MLNIALSGCNGRMGRVITEIVAGKPEMRIVAGFDVNTVRLADYPVYADPSACTEQIDVVIDFSNSSAVDALLAFCLTRRVPAVICTTGLSTEQLAAIDAASKEIPLFRSGNMSLGINLMMDLLRKCASVLGADYDVEIVEAHHNQKLDAPSGTALMLADAVSEALPYEPEYVYDRHERREKRPAHEIGMHSIRGGTIVGEHSVLFCGRDEVIEVKHSALSRDVFASGAVNAAVFLAGQTQPGLYNMSHVIASMK